MFRRRIFFYIVYSFRIFKAKERKFLHNICHIVCICIGNSLRRFLCGGSVLRNHFQQMQFLGQRCSVDGRFCFRAPPWNFHDLFGFVWCAFGSRHFFDGQSKCTDAFGVSLCCFCFVDKNICFKKCRVSNIIYAFRQYDLDFHGQFAYIGKLICGF